MAVRRTAVRCTGPLHIAPPLCSSSLLHSPPPPPAYPRALHSTATVALCCHVCSGDAMNSTSLIARHRPCRKKRRTSTVRPGNPPHHCHWVASVHPSTALRAGSCWESAPHHPPLSNIRPCCTRSSVGIGCVPCPTQLDPAPSDRVRSARARAIPLSAHCTPMPMPMPIACMRMPSLRVPMSFR